MLDVLKTINTNLPAMSKGHRRIATVIIEDCEQAAYLTAAALGAIAEVSESTVVRFATELGFRGYPHFQRALRETLRNRLTPNQRIDAMGHRIAGGDPLSAVMASDIQRIKDTMEHIDRAAFDAAVTALLEADTVYLFGARSASMLSGFLGMNLGMISDNVRTLQPTSASEVFEQLFPIGPRDVLFAISFPRYSQKLVKAVRYAHDRGAQVIALTDAPTSPIAAEANYLLTAQSDMAAFADSLVAPLSIINAMIIEITQRRRAEIKDRFERMERLWDEYDVYTKP
ncbi:MAG: MurR/RpiR family transcriptional regulator [Clostridia bacterium]|nr:MurR/RpiR family transcriptional regulator [Clostridia bacterium]